MIPTPFFRPFWIASGRNTGMRSLRWTPIPEAPSATMYPRSSTGYHDAASNKPPSASQDCLEKGVMPGVDNFLDEGYQRLMLPVKRRPAGRLLDIVTGATPIH